MWLLDHKEDWVLNCCFQIVVLEKTFESPLNSKEIKPGQSYRRSTLNSHWKDWGWSWSSNTLATSWEELTHWKRPWCWERLRAGREVGNREWDSRIDSLTWWTWVWANCDIVKDRLLSCVPKHFSLRQYLVIVWFE